MSKLDHNKVKKVTLDQIMSWKPCEEYSKDRIKKMMCRKKYITLNDLWKSKLDNKEDYLWLALHPEFLTDRQMHEVAIYAAELVLPLFEKEYPGDKRPREAIQAKKDWLDDKITDEDLKAAADARAAAKNTAGAAAWAAWAAWAAGAAGAARAAAGDAAWAAAGAAWAAWAAGDATWAAAATGAAAGDAIYDKIIKYIKKITREKGWEKWN